MRIDTPRTQFVRLNWQREMANLFDSEPAEMRVLAARPGSTIVYFQIDDPPAKRLMDASASRLSQLSGDEKMLLLYQWWYRADPHIQELSFDIEDYQLLTAQNRNNGKPPMVVPLFQPASKPSVIIPPQPFLSSNGITLVSGFRNSLATLAVQVQVASASMLLPPPPLLTLSSLLLLSLVAVILAA